MSNTSELLNKSIEYCNKGDMKKAIECCLEVLRNDNSNLHAHYNLANLCGMIGNKEKTIFHYKKVLELGGCTLDLLINLGGLVSETNCQEAVSYFLSALKINSEAPTLHYNLGYSYMILKDVHKAEFHYKKAIELKSDYWEAHVALAVLCFLEGKYEQAWPLYEKRFLKNATMRKELPILKTPLWQGEKLKGKTICVYTEQGLGDAINFVRYIEVLNKMGAKVLFKLHKRFMALETLFRDSKIKAEIIAPTVEDDSIKCDYYTSLLSIPAVLNQSINDIPMKNKYLKADTKKVKKYKKEYFDNKDFKLGIVWQCKNTQALDKYRSLPDLSYFYPFAKLKNVKVYSLQKGEGEKELENLPEGIEIINLGKTFNDFSDTAAAIENLDLVISVDTSVPHLAGALGKPTLVLLDAQHSWRWTYNLENSPWYDSAKLYRQEKQNDWSAPLSKALNEVKRISIC